DLAGRLAGPLHRRPRPGVLAVRLRQRGRVGGPGGRHRLPSPPLLPPASRPASPSSRSPPRARPPTPSAPPTPSWSPSDGPTSASTTWPEPSLRSSLGLRVARTALSEAAADHLYCGLGH